MTTPTPAFPTVGARAQVTVAEWTEDDGTMRPCWEIQAGDVVTVASEDSHGDWFVRASRNRSGLVAGRHLRPVPADQPGDDRRTDCGKCRSAGPGQRKPMKHVGPDQPTEHEDWWVSADSDRVVASGSADAVAMFASPEDAARAVADHQDAPALRAEVQRLTRLCDDYSDNLATRDRELTATSAGVARLTDIKAALTRQRDNLIGQVKARTAERDVARAELDAAHNTDGPGLPQVIERFDGIVECDEQDFAVGLLQPDALRRDALQSLALAAYIERARLADEATTDDKETDRG